MFVSDVTLPSLPSSHKALRLKLTLASFTVSIFVSAVLLFSVQPLFTKMVTPHLGGTPAVWSIALVFFQAVLLAGYGYAHLVKTYLPHRVGVVFHLVVMAVVLALFLPIHFDPSWGRPPQDGQALWLLRVFGVCVGLPFFAIAANGPLLQAWFARSTHPQAHDPYFLYGASNLGSMIALLAYPFVIEPALTLKEQALTWMVGFGILAILIGLSAVLLLRVMRSQEGHVEGHVEGNVAPSHALPSQVSVKDGLIWMVLAFIPSGLLVAVTAHISTDVAAVPLLWVVPLALFLLTFVFAFRTGGEWMHKGLLMARPIALVGLMAAMVLWNNLSWEFVIGIHLSFFFIVTMICHRELYNARPQADQLTAFYFYMSLGGVLGGVFCSLIAPVAFNSIVEYTLLILAAMLIDPGFAKRMKIMPSATIWRGVLAFVFTCVCVALVMRALPRLPLSTQMSVQIGIILALIGAAFLISFKEVRIGVIAGAVAAFLPMLGMSDIVIERTRSFFGVHMVRQTEDGTGRYLAHGTTIHGGERYRDEKGQVLANRPEPGSYYYPGGPYSEVILATRAAQGGKLNNTALIGMGIGSTACYSQAGENWTFFEIDPTVARLAQNPAYFRSMHTCMPQAPIVFGDGRLTLAEQNQTYDLIVIDAFSSDAIPIHLLTTEAVKMYRSKLAQGGVIMFHITNRHLALAPVVAGSAQANGMIAYLKRDEDEQKTGEFAKTMRSKAHIVAVAVEEKHLGALPQTTGWHLQKKPDDFRIWTDDYSNLIDAIKRKRRGE
jgi:spermidine synthase